MWNSHINSITAKANKLLGLLKRTCPLLTDVKVRRTLYLTIVKSQVSYATEIWSPSLKSLKAKIERVQRRATRWILRVKPGKVSYKDRLLKLNLLPLAYDREIKDLLFFYKALHGDIDLDVKNFVNFLNHGRTRLSQKTTLLKVPLCRTTTFQSSYFNRIVKLWNCACNVVNISTFSSPDNFQIFLKDKYFNLLNSIFDTDLICTWSSVRDCPCHKS